MIRMLLVGYCYGIRSERRLCEEVNLNLAYRWFCRLGLEDTVPDHSTFSRARTGRFREADILRKVFETTVRTCMDKGLVGGEGFATDASIIRAHATKETAATLLRGHRHRSASSSHQADSMHDAWSEHFGTPARPPLSHRQANSHAVQGSAVALATNLSDRLDRSSSVVRVCRRGKALALPPLKAR